MIFLIFIVYLLFNGYGDPLSTDIFFQSQNSVDLISFIIIVYIVYSFTYNMNYSIYHEEFIEWAFSFIIMSRLKYHHLLYLRNIHHRMHYFYRFCKIFIVFCIKELKKILKILPMLIGWYLLFDLDYTYNGLEFLIEKYNEEYKHLVLYELFLSFIDL